MYTIYALVSSDSSNDIRYIGLTINPKKRLREHISESKDKKYHRHKWICSVISDGFKVEMLILNSGINTLEEAKEIEINRIAEYNLLGHSLTNGTNGGDGEIMSEEAKEKHRNSMMKNWGVAHITQHPSIRKKLSDLRKGKSFDELFGPEKAAELKQRLREVNLGNKGRGLGMTLEEIYGKEQADIIRLKMSAANKGREAHNKGKQTTQENKAKLVRAYILQKDLNGNIIRTWKGMVEINASSEFNRENVSVAIRLGKPYKGFIWEKIPNPNK